MSSCPLLKYVLPLSASSICVVHEGNAHESHSVQNSIVDEYRKFHDLIRAEFDFTTAASIMTPSAVHTLLVSDVKASNGTAAK